MTIAKAHIASHGVNWTPVAKTGGFLNYVRIFCEAFSEGLQQASDARRKYPFADV